MKPTNRREFIKKTSLSLGVLPLVGYPFNIFMNNDINNDLSVHIFSKHLQFLDYEELGAMAAEMEFSGVDLTVRPKGHVLPEFVKKDLPIAIQAIEKGGSSCSMITTSVESIHSSLDVDVLTTATQSGIKYYRTNWFKYNDDLTLEASLEKYRNQIKELGDFNKKVGIIGCYQNHAGKDIGASFWELKKLLETADSDYFGLQYDIRHATVEGGKSWENGLKLLHRAIKTIVLKDFKWGKVNGKWDIVNVPIGEGMVDFDTYFKLLKYYNLKPPVSLHLEYDLGGAEKGKRELSIDKKLVFDAMRKDLKTIQTIWEKA